MKRRTFLMGTAAGASAASAAGAAPEVRFRAEEGSLRLTRDDAPLAVYTWGDPQILRPYFAHLHAPGGVRLSRNHPPRPGTDAVDHYTMHPGLWLAFGDLGGEDFWRNRGTVRHEGFSAAPRAEAGGVAFTAGHRYVARDGRTLAREAFHCRVLPRTQGWLLLWDSTFSAEAATAFGDQEEMGLGIRFHTPLSVRSGGQIRSAAGGENEKGVWGTQAEWCDYRGAVEGRPAGLMMMTHPGNFRPCWLHARDYGLLVANPFGRNAFTRGEKSSVPLAPGSPLRLRFGLLAHGELPDPAAAYRDYVASSNTPSA